MKVKIRRIGLVQIRLSYIYFFVLLVPFFEPMYFKMNSLTHRVYAILRVISIIIIFARFVRLRDYTRLRPVIPLILYCCAQLISSIFNGGSVGEEIRAYLYYIFPCLLISISVKDQAEDIINVLYVITGIICIIQALSIILFPNGLFLDSYYNRYPVWFWDTAGHMSSILICFGVLAVINLKRNVFGTNLFFCFINCIYLYLIGFVFRDAGNFIGLIFFLGCCICMNVFKRAFVTPLTSFGFLMLMNVGLIAFNIQKYFSYVIVEIFNKDLTLTNRTIVWDLGIISVLKNPILGKGLPSSMGVNAWLLRNGIAYSSHNQLLDITVNGGVFTLAFFLAYMYLAYKGLDKIGDYRIKMILMGGITSIGIIMLADTLSPYLPVYILYTFALCENNMDFIIQDSVN